MRNKYFILAFTSLVLAGCQQNVDQKLLSSYVDTRIGTGVYHSAMDDSKTSKLGQTLPAVLVPNGMNFWTPQTDDTEQKCIAPYYYDRDKIQGFRNSHWIVGGCTQDYGTMTLMPIMGDLKCQPDERASAFSHDNEVSTPYYYSVKLDDYGINAEMTATSRAAIFRFTYDKAGEASLVINPNSDEGLGSITYDAEKNEVFGSNPVHRIYQGWGEEAGFSGYFSVKVDKKITSYGTFTEKTVQEGQTSISKKDRLGMYLRFHVEKGEEVLVKVSSSFCNVEGARKNMTAEIPHWDFNKVKNELSDTWEKRLSAISVETPDSIAKTKFYSSLYHASFLPHALNDVDGSYPAFAGGGKIHKAEGNYYDDFSMWDTYRALHPLLCILDPEQTGEMVQSLVHKYEQGTWMPIFPCWNSYTAAMIGDHCASLISDAYAKGVRNFDAEKAYQGLRQNAFDSPATFEEYKDGKGRRALKSYIKYGYIPLEDSVKEAFHKREQVSRTLEYAYDDFALSRLAEALDHKDDAEKLMKRSQSFRNVIDPRTGYAQGRHADGTFVSENNAFRLEKFITEGFPCHYTWYVPHDPYGLMECMGGKDKYVAKLDSMFTQGYYWHGNEPCHQVAFMFNYAGMPWKTQQVVRNVMETEYNVGPSGLSGNDDAGQMSAWYVFAAVGFYPVCPGTPYYMLASPSFDKTTIRMSSGKKFVITAKNASKENVYIQSATLNGKAYDKNYISHSDIVTGGEMEFVMGNTPNKNWASSVESCPPHFFK